jgi:hypothetical protein
MVSVRYQERRHRLQGDELQPVKEAVYRDLVRRIELRDDLLVTACLFRVWFRMETYCTNKPSYPGHSTWEELEAFLGFSTVSPYTESALDMAVRMDLRMRKEGT